MNVDFGRDIRAVNDLDVSFSLVGGEENLGNALARRLSTTRGYLFRAFGGDPDYGLGLINWLNADFTAPTIAALETEIEAECRKDERVQDCNATVTHTFGTQSILVELEVTTAEGPFRLVLKIGDLTVEILNDGLPVASETITTGTGTVAAAVVGADGAAGPPGPPGSPGSAGGAVVEIDDPAHYQSNTGAEDVIPLGLQDFDSLPGGTLSAKLVAWVSSAGGTATFRLRIGGTRAGADGTVVATITSTSATLEAKKATGTFANPGGLQALKLSLQSSAAAVAADIEGAEAEIRQ